MIELVGKLTHDNFKKNNVHFVMRISEEKVYEDNLFELLSNFKSITTYCPYDSVKAAKS